MTPEAIALNEIEMNPAVNIREQLDEETIQWYMTILDDLPPIVVYHWNGTKLLADGFHRYAAAERLGRKQIATEVREGSREDAWIYAAVANFRHGRNLSLMERDRAIERVATLKPDWIDQQVADEFGVKRKVVERARHAIRLQRELRSPETSTYEPTKLAIVSRAPDTETAGKLLEQAERNKWTRDQLQDAVRTVNDPKVSDTYKEAVIEGTAPPMMREGVIRASEVDRIVSEARRYDPVGRLWTVSTAIAALREFTVEDVVAAVQPKDAERLLRFIDEDVAFITAIARKVRHEHGG